MQVVNPQIVSGKKILLRYDIDVALGSAQGKLVVGEEFKLKAGLETLNLCLENASKVILIGHLGRPFATAEDEKKGNPKDLSAQPIYEWFKENVTKEIEFASTIEQTQNSNSKFVLLENIRFFHGEVECDVDFAKKLAGLADVYVNEAFSSHNPAASTTIVPTLLPHYAGLHFVKEVETLLKVRNNPKKPFVAIMGGAKVKDKLPVINVLAQKADSVLVGGKLVAEIRDQSLTLPKNVLVGKLNQDGFDIAEETTSSWAGLISKAAMIVWNGPLGKFEEEEKHPVDASSSPVDSSSKYNQTQKVVEMILNSGAEIVIGGGDSVAALNQYGLFEKAEKKAFVSVGGGAMLKLLADGTLPTIEALK